MTQSLNTPSENRISDQSHPVMPSRFPQTVVTSSREELHEPIQLNVRDTEDNAVTLPDDLQGYYFLVSPVGVPNSTKVDPEQEVVWVSQDGWTALYNGDGMVYRLSFDGGNAKLKTCLMKPPCYYADDGMVYRLSFDGGNAKLKTCLMKPPCYYADLATSQQPEVYSGLGFSNNSYSSYQNNL